jgi:MFS family permease
VSVLRSNPPLRRLLGAWLQSCLGTGAGYVALLLATTHYLHSSLAVSAVLLADFLPAIVFGSWFGLLADRYSRRVLIVAANLIQAAAFGGLALAHTAPSILTLALLAGVGNALLGPSLRSAIPVIAGDDSQVAVALNDTARWVGITLGPLIAAALFALSGVALPLALNGISFLIAAGVLATIPIGRPAPAEQVPGAGAAATAAAHGGGVRAGLAAAFAAPGILAVVACSAGSIIAGGLLNVSEPFLATHTLHGSGSDYALLVACYGVGMVAASALVARGGAMPATIIARRYLAALLLTAAGMGASAIVDSVAAATVAFAATGYANALLLVSETQLIQLRVANSVQGRLFGAKTSIEGACFLVGLLSAGVLVDGVGVRFTLAAGGVICAFCAIAGFVALGVRWGRVTALSDSTAAAGTPRGHAAAATTPHG